MTIFQRLPAAIFAATLLTMASQAGRGPWRTRAPACDPPQRGIRSQSSGITIVVWAVIGIGWALWWSRRRPESISLSAEV